MVVVCHNGTFVLWLFCIAVVLHDVTSQLSYPQAFKKLGDSCTVDTECHDNMVCATNITTTTTTTTTAAATINKACVCDTGFTIKSDRTCGKPVGSWCPSFWSPRYCGNKMSCDDHRCNCTEGSVIKMDGSCGMKYKDVCSSTLDCGDHMICVGGTCLCDAGYSNTTIETCETPCLHEICSPGGRCYHDDPGNLLVQSCYCLPGFAGPTCQYQTVVYDIYVTTGSNDHAGTETDPTLTISGSQGTTARLTLSKSENYGNTILNKGRVDHFKHTARDVGEVTNLTLSYQNILSYIIDRWYPIHLSISKEGTLPMYTFLVDTWIYVDNYVTLLNPCVMPNGCDNATSCTQVGLTSHTYACWCNSTSPACWTDYRCPYGDALYDAQGSTSPADFECGHTADSHAAIVESTQQLINVSECVCQRDVTGFYVYLLQPRDIPYVSATQQPPSTSCSVQDRDTCENMALSNCYTRNDWTLLVCPTKCGYCTDDWTVAGDHRYRRVSGTRFYNASLLSNLEVHCRDYEVLLFEVACFGPNTYDRPALCQGGRDLSGLMTCPTVATTTTVDDDTSAERETSPPEPPITTAIITTTETTEPPPTTTTTTMTSPDTPESCRMVCESTTASPSPSPSPSPASPTPASPAPCNNNNNTSSSNLTGPQIPDNMSLDEFKAQLVAQIKKQLSLNKSSLAALTKTRAKKISAPDTRPSSQTAGIVAVVLIVCVGGLMVMSDLSTLVVWWRGRARADRVVEL